METKPALQQRRWLIPLLASLLLCSLLISLLLFSSSPSFSHQTLLFLSFYQIRSAENPLFVESKLLPSSEQTNPLPRLAYLISGSAGDGGSLRRTLKALYHPGNRYVVHLDLEASPAERMELVVAVRDDQVFSRVGNVRVIERANLVTYRGPTMVANTLHAAAILLREGGDWDWFINLSASDYPLVTQDGEGVFDLMDFFLLFWFFFWVGSTKLGILDDCCSYLGEIILCGRPESSGGQSQHATHKYIPSVHAYVACCDWTPDCPESAQNNFSLSGGLI